MIERRARVALAWRSAHLTRREVRDGKIVRSQYKYRYAELYEEGLALHEAHLSELRKEFDPA